jgi:hypothetical protein
VLYLPNTLIVQRRPLWGTDTDSAAAEADAAADDWHEGARTLILRELQHLPFHVSPRAVSETPMTPLVMPGKYIPRFRWFPWLFKQLVGVRRFGRIAWPEPGFIAKLYADITDADRCQRGPTGKPLYKLTPFVPFLTLQEWKEK